MTPTTERNHQTPDAERCEVESFDYDRFDALIASGELCFDTPEEEEQFWQQMRAAQ